MASWCYKMPMHKSSSRDFIRLAAAVTLGGMLVAGCRRGEQGPVTITETRQAAPLQEIPTEQGTAARLGLEDLPPNHPALDAAGVGRLPADTDEAGSAPLAWTAPEGWTQGAARPMRLVTFACGVESGVECYVAELGGMGGGLAANFNRWRKQLGQPPMSEADIAALPRITVFGAEAPLLEVGGAYSGMGQGQPAQADSKLLGTMASSGDRAFFVKLVGPAAAVDAQREKFTSFCGSLKLGGE